MNIRPGHSPILTDMTLPRRETSSGAVDFRIRIILYNDHNKENRKPNIKLGAHLVIYAIRQPKKINEARTCVFINKRTKILQTRQLCMNLEAI